VPVLGETLARYEGRTHLALEIKQEGVEADVLAVVQEHDLLLSVTFTSFSFSVVAWVKANCPQAKVGYLSRSVGPEEVQRTLDARLDQFCPPADSLTRELVAGWQARGLEVRAWGVRDVELMHRAIRARVDGMTVDSPHLLLEALGRGSGRISST
jgi:glycerophosphoryl diester phosphodiesterase